MTRHPMTPRYRRNILIIALLHVGGILGIAVVGWIRDLIPEKPPEITTFVELREPAPPSPAPPSPAPTEPEPEPPPPEPDPPPPEPEPPRPKPKLKKADEIQVSKKRVSMEDTPPKPTPRKRLRPEDVAQALRPDTPRPNPAAPDNFPFEWYYALVRRAFYEVWQQPSAASVPPGAMTRMSIRVQRDGRITQSHMTRSSGNAAMDASVMQAVGSIPRLKELPTQYVGDYKEISMDFELTGVN